MAKILRKKQVIRQVPKGRVYIRSSFNNTLITATDAQGGTLTWTTAGSLGFAGSRKSTPYAAMTAMKELIERLKGYGVSEVDVFVSGVGAGREQAIRAFGGSGIMVGLIKDITPIPHNGVRARKPRKV
ncbi:30S ribosomal protein S11 [Candidatus Berkelbacteria bacterium]|nr:30S ribosomal protein S11 [Candidatus Berkelbacteria bacterium]